MTQLVSRDRQTLAEFSTPGHCGGYKTAVITGLIGNFGHSYLDDGAGEYWKPIE